MAPTLYSKGMFSTDSTSDSQVLSAFSVYSCSPRANVFTACVTKVFSLL